ncbi:MAG: AI-2E family transporter [Nitrospirota bacterium]
MSDAHSRPALSNANIFSAAFFLVLLFLLYQAGLFIAPFLSAVIWAAVIVIVLHPLYEKLLKFVRGRKNLAAGIMTVFTLILVISPAVLLFALLTAQVADLFAAATEFVQSGRFVEVLNRLKTSSLGAILDQPVLAEMDIKSHLIKGLGDFSAGMIGQLGLLIKNTLLAVLNLFIMLFVIFFFFRDGKAYARELTDILPLPRNHKKSIMEKLGNTFSAVLNGLFLVAMLQGFMTGVGFFLFGVPYGIFWGFLAMIASLLPFGGTALVWIPGAFYLFLKGSTLKAVLLTVWGVLLVSTPDNFLKPILIGRKAKLPTFFLFLGILGGIHVYGILGILFGPMIVTLLTAFVQIYREEYGEQQG